MTTSARQRIGRTGEQLALEHYLRLGYTLLDRNYRTRTGELDLILCDGACIVFVEVKTRSAGGHDPLLAIDAAKRRRLRRLAGIWLAAHPVRPRARELRIDAVAIVLDARGGLVSLDALEGIG